MMKKTLLTAMACILALGLSASTASALAIGDANYLGYADPGSPADATSEVHYIDFLLGMALGDTETEDTSPPPGEVRTYVRSNTACVGCPEPTTANDDSGNAPSGSVDVTGWTYLVAKYGNVSHVWYVGDLDGFQDVPLEGFGGFNKQGDPQTNGQSHYSLYNPETVPDGGATAGLLGLAMLGLGYLRRRIS
jgi:hypothetical protein